MSILIVLGVKLTISSPTSILYYRYTRNEFASLAHSFYTYLKLKLMHLTTVLFSSRKYGNLFYMKLYTVKKFMIGHVAAQRGWLNFNINTCMRMCTSLTDQVTLSISYPEKLPSCLTVSLERAPKKRRL